MVLVVGTSSRPTKRVQLLLQAGSGRPTFTGSGNGY